MVSKVSTYYKRIVVSVAFICTAMLLCQPANAWDGKHLYQLIERRLPALKNKVVFISLNNIQRDTASYQTKAQKLYITASTKSAASYALNDFLKKYCNSSFSETGDNIQLPKHLPTITKPVAVSAFYPIRYALNYCTYNYSMSFWKWSDWEIELDRMALNGVNLMLAPMGTEEVWQKTLEEFGYTDKEIRNYLPGPAYNAWWLMGNLEGWGGPISDNIIQHYTALQQKMLARMQELGIEPVVQSFWGMVPSNLKQKFPNANIVAQGKWLGMYERPAVLVSSDSLFQAMAAVYYKHFKKLYGTNFKYLGGDLFHEGGVTKGMNLTQLATDLQKNMQLHFPNASWVLQGWQDNPKTALLKGLDKNKTLILDLLGDRSENWEKRLGYEQFPWVWCTITNFGGKQAMEGKLLRTITEPKRASNHSFGKTLQGVGIIPEAIENNTIVYQTILNGAWTSTITNSNTVIEEYVQSRYGKKDKKLIEAWQYLLQSVYFSHSQVQAGGYESIFAARPDSNTIKTISCCGPQNKWYDTELLVQAANLFAQQASSYSSNQAFLFDLTDIWRQVVNVKARSYYDKLMLAIKQKNSKQFEYYKSRFTTLLTLQNEWLATNDFFNINTWLNKANSLFSDKTDKALAIWNAKAQITFWGNDNPKTILHEYAAKEWSGILSTLHLSRWEAFFDWANGKIENRSNDYPNFFEMEKKWVDNGLMMESKSTGNIDIILKRIKTELGKPDMNADGSFPDFYN